MTGKETQGNPRGATPEGNTMKAFILPANRPVPLPEALVRFVASLAGGDIYRQCVPM